MTDLALKVLLQAQDQASGTVKGFLNTLTGFAGATGPIITGLVGISTAVIGLSAVSLKTAADFQEVMDQTRALAGLTDQQATQATQAILKMAPAIGQTPQKLAEGLYYVKSAGYEAADALSILEKSAKAAKTGNVDTEVTANALTSSLKAMGVGADQAQHYIDMMTASISNGKTEWKDYAPIIGQVSLNAKQAGVSFAEATTAFSTLTNTMPSSRQAASSLNALLQTSSRFDLLAQRADKLGISFDENAYKSMNLIQRVQYLNQVTGGNSEQMAKLLGRQNAVAAVTALLTNNSKDYNDILKQVNNSQGAADQAFKKSQEGFNAAADRFRAALDVVLIKIGTGLLPILTKLTDVGTPALMGIVTNGEKVVDFFKNNQTAMDGLKAGLAGFAVFVAAIIIPAFISWAIAAGSAAVATLAATWPIVLAAVIVAAVVFGILVAIRNWGAITAWLSEQWGRFSGWFMGMLGAVGAWFVGIWNGMVSGLRSAWSAIVGAAQAGLAFLVSIFTSPFRAIGQLFTWLYNHNRYFKMLIDAIRVIVAAGLAWLAAQWQAGVNRVVGFWSWLVSMASARWNAMLDAIRSAFSGIWATITSFLAMIISYWQGQWNNAVSLVTGMWQRIQAIFASAWSTFIASPLGQLLTNITNFFTSLPGKALSWGQNMINGFIQGIRNKIGEAGQAAQEIAQNIANFLGFHSPAEEGPGAELDQWPVNFIDSYARGLEAGAPVIRQAANTLALQFTPLTAERGTATAPATTGGAQARVTGGGNVYYITINAGSANAREVVRQLTRELNRSGNIITSTSGGRI